jgi:hypothetical protein
MGRVGMGEEGNSDKSRNKRSDDMIKSEVRRVKM